MRLAVCAGAAALLLVCALGQSARAVDNPDKLLPAGAQKELVVEHCQTCHSATLIVQQRISEKAWTAELVKMEKWGATLPPEQNAAVASYLAKYFNPEAPDGPPRMVVAPKQPG